MTRVAIIPARGGSKRVPRKNVRPFLGRPMIIWSIAAAQDAGLFDRIVVTTDDADIAAIARAAGAEVPFLRAPDLANDTATVTAVVQDAVRQLRLAPADDVCLIYATAPLVSGADLAAGLARLTDSGVDYCMSVARFEVPLMAALETAADGLLHPHPVVATLDGPDALYHDAAQFIWGTAAAWLSDRRAMRDATAAHVIDPFRVQDIDTPEDWHTAEMKARVLYRMVPPGDLRLRPARTADWQALLDWRNDPATVAASLTPGTVDEAGHRGWLDRMLQDPGVTLWIAEDATGAVGTVRLTPLGDGKEVSITLAPTARGRGLAAVLIALACTAPVPYYARIKPGNAASRRAFETAGFQWTHAADGTDWFTLNKRNDA